MHEMHMQILMTIVTCMHSAEVTLILTGIIQINSFIVVNPTTSINWIQKQEGHRRQ